MKPIKMIYSTVKSAVSTQSADIVNFPHPNGIIGSGEQKVAVMIGKIMDSSVIIATTLLAGTHDMNLLFFTLNQGVVSIACQSGISGVTHRSRLAASASAQGPV